MRYSEIFPEMHSSVSDITLPKDLEMIADRIANALSASGIKDDDVEAQCAFIEKFMDSDLGATVQSEIDEVGSLLSHGIATSRDVIYYDISPKVETLSKSINSNVNAHLDNRGLIRDLNEVHELSAFYWDAVTTMSSVKDIKEHVEGFAIQGLTYFSKHLPSLDTRKSIQFSDDQISKMIAAQDKDTERPTSINRDELEATLRFLRNTDHGASYAHRCKACMEGVGISTAREEIVNLINLSKGIDFLRSYNSVVEDEIDTKLLSEKLLDLTDVCIGLSYALIDKRDSLKDTLILDQYTYNSDAMAAYEKEGGDISKMSKFAFFSSTDGLSIARAGIPYTDVVKYAANSIEKLQARFDKSEARIKAATHTALKQFFRDACLAELNTAFSSKKGALESTTSLEARRLEQWRNGLKHHINVLINNLHSGNLEDSLYDALLQITGNDVARVMFNKFTQVNHNDSQIWADGEIALLTCCDFLRS